MKASELRSKPIKELQQELVELLREQFNLRMQKTTGQLNKVHLLKNVRRNIATVKTVLTELKGKA